jgi:Fur family ferric uptake transcriptional regulator
VLKQKYSKDVNNGYLLSTIATVLRKSVGLAPLCCIYSLLFFISTNMSPPSDADARVDDALGLAGLRRTAATLALARLFRGAGDVMLAHTQIGSALMAQGLAVNRVPVYRLLDRFVAAGLLSRSVDAQRVSRFALASFEGKTAPYFECDDCHRHFRLTDSAKKLNDAARQVLRILEAAGHEGHTIDVSICGRGAGCATGMQSRSFW